MSVVAATVTAVEDAEYAGAMAPVYASAAAELARLLKEAAGTSGGLSEPVDAFAVLWNVTSLLEDMSEALQRVGGWLDREAAQGRVSVDFGPYQRHPDDAVGVVTAYLSAVDRVLVEAAAGLRAAHTIAETLTTTDPDVPRDGIRDVSTDVDTADHWPAAGASLLAFPDPATRSLP